MKEKWVITCEHGGNQIPAAYAPFFEDAGRTLQTHRGYDPGALALFHLLARDLADFSYFSQTSRLLVELNRSLNHKDLFSAYSKRIPSSGQKEIIDRYYLPYRKSVEDKIRQFNSEGDAVIHLSIHSFTPELNGEVRKADIGLLYDPGKKDEKAFCAQWKKHLNILTPDAVVRFNYPYKGKADGFTTSLRKCFPEKYIGIELEVNQKHALQPSWHQAILESLRQIKVGEGAREKKKLFKEDTTH